RAQPVGLPDTRDTGCAQRSRRPVAESVFLVERLAPGVESLLPGGWLGAACDRGARADHRDRNCQDGGDRLTGAHTLAEHVALPWRAGSPWRRPDATTVGRAAHG